MANVSLQVLFNGGTAPGWKLVACIELCSIAAFYCFLVAKGITFLLVVKWEPAPNVRRLRLADTWRLLDKNNDNDITLDELIDASPKLGLTATQATVMFEELDENKSGSIDWKEFNDGFKGALVAAELTTPVERFWAYFVQPRRPAGHYTALDPEKTNMRDPWVSVFTSFTPFHVHFLVLRLTVMLLEAFILTEMSGKSQGLALMISAFISMSLVLWSPPATLLAQSRADSIDAIGKFLTFGIYSTIFPKWMTTGTAAQAMTVVNGVMLLHSIFTQLEPIFRFVLFYLLNTAIMQAKPGTDGEEENSALTSLSGSLKTKPGTDREEENSALTSLSGSLSTKDAVSLVWQRLSAQTSAAGSIPEPFYQALKDMKERNEKNAAFTKAVIFDAVLFGEGLAPLDLSEMNSAVAAVLLQQVSTNGNLLSNAELCTLVTQPKYSSEGRVTPLEKCKSRDTIMSKDSFAGISSSKERAELPRSSSNAKTKKLKDHTKNSQDVELV
jgi:hypothetical protein